MKVLFICKASTKIGFGHLVRTMTVANTFKRLGKPGDLLNLIVIGDNQMKNLMSSVKVPYQQIPSEIEISNVIQEQFDSIFLDLLDLDTSSFDFVKAHGSEVISISPVFNYLHKVDVLFHRSKYIALGSQKLPPKSFMGLKYAIIQENCKKIGAGNYERNLNLEHLPIAISMGGGDAANKTLQIIKTLRDCPVPVTFWVILGEGYKHSYDQLVEEIKGHQEHEIILARTNKSMWQILNNCALVISLSGITAYEAVYAGLPSIIYYDNDTQRTLAEELFEEQVALDHGMFQEKALPRLNETIADLYNKRRKLFDMHLNSKSLISKNGAERIFSCVQSKLVIG